jgi:disulfide bond formation protein DsbB
MNFVALTQSMAALSLLGGAGGLLLLILMALPASRQRLTPLGASDSRTLLAMGALLAFGAMVGSLYFSEVVGFVPCSLCWYQRIAMYPLVVVLGVAAVRNEPGGWAYALPLALIGLVIALYHVTIQQLPALDVGACGVGVPCTSRYLAVFGFVSIPVMALGVFLPITGILVMVRAGQKAG